MIDSPKLRKRDLYLDKLIAFQDTEPVKIVTGIRRCGKSSVLKLMIAHLKEKGIAEDQIVQMNFESHACRKMTSEDIRCRELASLQKISDSYEKIILSLDPGLNPSYEGTKSINLIEWLVGE